MIWRSDWTILFAKHSINCTIHVSGNRPLSTVQVSRSQRYFPDDPGQMARRCCSVQWAPDSWRSWAPPSQRRRPPPTASPPASSAAYSSPASCFVKCWPHSHQHWITTWSTQFSNPIFWKFLCASVLTKVLSQSSWVRDRQDRQEIGKIPQTNNVVIFLTYALNIAAPTTFLKNWLAKGDWWSS